MKRLIIALAGLAVLAGCEKTDPTQKHDYGCTRSFGEGDKAMSACIQVRVTEVEGNAAEAVCERNQSGATWAYSACTSTNRVPGYCQLDDAKDYTLSGKPAKVYFYSEQWDQAAAAAAAEDACKSASGTTWVPPAT